MTMFNPPHPGRILRDLIIEPLDLTIKEVADRLGVGRKTLSKIVNSKGAITPEMALRLELLFQNPCAEHWMRMQNAYDLWQTKQHLADFNIVPLERKTA